MRQTTLLSTTASLLLASGCVADLSADPATGLVAASSESSSVIVGGVNWQDITALDATSPERVASHAVGYLALPAQGARCTAFLIAQDVIMTNEHCVPNANAAQGATAAFAYETGTSTGQRAMFDCSTFLGNDADLDFALLQCTGSPGATQGVVTLDDTEATSGEALYVIHQNCDYYAQPWCDPTKKLSRGEVKWAANEVAHTADTLGGSSGAPVFRAANNSVFALHHVGVGGNGSGRGSYNQAVPMSRILPALRNRFPQLQLGGGAVVAPTPPPGDALEPNNTQGAATPIGDGTRLSDLSITRGDRDIFKVQLDAPATLNLALTFRHAHGDLDVTVHAGSVSTTAVATADSGDDNEALSVSLGAGTYYLVVYAFSDGGGSNTYALALDLLAATNDAPVTGQVEQPAAGATDVMEPNNTFTDASAIPLPFSAALRIDENDEDYFKFETAGGVHSCQIDFDSSLGDLDLYLYKASGEKVAESIGTDDTERVDVDLAAGAYTVHVLGYSGATADYTIRCQ